MITPDDAGDIDPSTGKRWYCLFSSGKNKKLRGIRSPKGLARAFRKRELDPDVCRRNIGSDWQTLQVAFKPLPVCAFNQTPVTVALKPVGKISGRKVLS
ncbi:hypothetical protein GA0061100_11822 [Rhizobium hainanense]|uniref:Uncharacterized protein n=1 Tax=Rhizobium hainanense TaxID=52131 RepID=A0A1C3WGW5_9HYPH|nr:hypothetical protein GA0061100_11822 [Rhizobium hainanense]